MHGQAPYRRREAPRNRTCRSLFDHVRVGGVVDIGRVGMILKQLMR